jgi:RNA polymerase sigma-70 factor (ECF subfamily)
MTFHDLYTRYARDVHRFALYLSCDPGLADDLTSETFLRAWTATTPIREASVKAYLFTIARNLYLLERRRTSRHQELDEAMPSASPTQEERLEHQTILGAVVRALKSLPETDRAALLMRTQDNMSYEEIAAALELSLSSAKVKVHRARLKLATLVPERIPL